MNARAGADKPPDPANEKAGLAPGAIHESENHNRQNTPNAGPAQPAPRWQVRTTKTNGCAIVFSEYSTLLAATSIAQRLRAVGGNAHVVEVRQ